MKAMLKTAAGIFAVIPGIGVLQSGLGVPPEEGMRLIFGGVIEFFGVLSLLLLTINQAWIRSLTKRAVTVVTVLIAGSSFLLILAYVGSYQYCVVTSVPRGTVYFPLWNEGGLANMVSVAGGRAAAIDMYGRYAVYEAVEAMGEIPEIVTSAVLTFLYTGVFTSITWAFGLPAIHEASGAVGVKKKLA